MAVYNPDTAYFRAAIESVLNQSTPVHELILVNDGGSESFMSSLPGDGRIRVFSKSNEGVALTRNFAIEQASGDFIAMLDQDDFWFPDKIREQLSLIPPSDPVCMVVSPVEIIDAEGKKREKKSADVLANYLLKAHGEHALFSLLGTNFIHSSAPLVHRAIFERTGGFDPAMQPHDDWDMYLRIALAGYPIRFYRKKPLSVWRTHGSNESGKRDAMLQSKLEVQLKLLALLKDPALHAFLRRCATITRLEADNLLFGGRQYRRFRNQVRGHLKEYLHERILPQSLAAQPAELLRHTLAFQRGIVVKSARRFLVSLFMNEKSIRP